VRGTSQTVLQFGEKSSSLIWHENHPFPCEEAGAFQS
jgi:hypothetical protein